MSLYLSLLIYFLEIMIAELSSCKVTRFYLVSVAKQAGLNLTWLATAQTGFLALPPPHILK